MRFYSMKEMGACYHYKEQCECDDNCSIFLHFINEFKEQCEMSHLFPVMTAQQECLQFPLVEMDSTISPHMCCFRLENMDVLT